MLCMGLTLALADDVKVRFCHAGSDQTVVASTNQTSLYRLNWDGLDGGGQDELSVLRENTRIVVIEGAISSSKGIGTEKISKTFIPVDKLPYTLVVAGATVTVFRVAQKMDASKSPGQAP